MKGTQLTRRGLLGRAALGTAAFTLGRFEDVALARPGGGGTPLPSPKTVRRDIQRMVDFGPRLTGSLAHNRFIDWISSGLSGAGVTMLPRDQKPLVLWDATDYGLEILGGTSPGPVPVAAYLPRSQETGAGGVTGPLHYLGAAPAPSLTASPDAAAIEAAVEQYPGQVASWAEAMLAALPAEQVQGSIMLVDLPIPAPLTEGIFIAMENDFHWSGHTIADTALRDYKRLWIVAGTGTSTFQQRGAAGVVFILDASYTALKGDYAPFGGGFEQLPALYVDRDTGTALRLQAASRPSTRLTLTATRKNVTSPSIVGVLPGSSEETMVLNTHTDGQNFVEENGGVALVHLARYFASLPADKRLRRTLVFSAVTGHMAPGMPQTQGFIDDHPDLVSRAAAAITMEHLGCQEWVDSTGPAGYHYTGDPEGYGVWTSQGTMEHVTYQSVVDNDIPHAGILRGPPQFGIGGAFQSAGVPQVGWLAGPNYLVSIVGDGHMDKLDDALAAKQIAWNADLVQRLDKIPAADLKSGDPTLGG
jgi:hypothetical protein